MRQFGIRVVLRVFHVLDGDRVAGWFVVLVRNDPLLNW